MVGSSDTGFGTRVLKLLWGGCVTMDELDGGNDDPVTAQPPMPPELTDLVIDFLHNDRASLKNCSLVSHQWLPAARYHLFHTLNPMQMFHDESLLKLLDSSPDIGRYVHTVIDWSLGPYGELAKYLVNLHTFDLSYIVLNSFEELTKPLSHLTSLRELRIFQCQFQVEEVVMTTAPTQIDTLYILLSSFDVVEFTEWARAANMFQHLRKFGFSGHGTPSRFNENLGLCTLLSTAAATLSTIELGNLNSAHIDGSFTC